MEIIIKELIRAIDVVLIKFTCLKCKKNSINGYKPKRVSGMQDRFIWHDIRFMWM